MGSFSYLRIVRDEVRFIWLRFLIPVSIIVLLLFSPHIYSSPKNNTLIYLGPVDVSTLDPGLVTDRYSSEVIANIFEGLTRYEGKSINVEPCLAESWKMFAKGRRWVFKIRKGVKFHDGEPLTAFSVVNSFSVRLRTKEKYKEWNSFYTYLEKVAAFGTHTVQFLLSEPYAPFLYQLASPKSSIIGSSSYESDNFKVVGTGPFVLGERKPGKFIKILRNESYWNRKAYLSAVIFKTIKDQRWRILQVSNGTADVSLLESMLGYNEITNKKNLRVLSVKSAVVSYLSFNTRRGPFRDRRMREALAHLINKEVVISNIFQNFGKNATSPVPPGIFGHNPQLKDYKFDLGEAKRLKIEAGYKSEIEVSLYYGKNSQNLENIAVVLTRSAKKIGIIIKRNPVSFSELLNIGYNKHDMLMMGWVGDIPDADVYLYPNFTEHSGSLNKSGYINPRLSNLINKARRVSDKEVRKNLYFESQEILHNDLPWIPLYYPNELLLHNRNVKNLSIQPLSFLNFRDVFFSNKNVIDE